VTDDPENVLVFTIFGICMTAVIVGYLVAWRSRRDASRNAGSWLVAAVLGFAGIFISIWIIAALMPFQLGEEEPWWDIPAFLLILAPFPLGAFYFCAKFIRRARRTDGVHSGGSASSNT